LFLAVVVCAPPGAVAQQPHAAQAAAKPFTTADAQKLTADILARCQAIRGIGLKRKLDISVKNRPELRKYLIERMKKDMPPELVLATQKGLQKLGLIPKTMDLEAFELDLLTEQVAGFYDEDAKKLFLMAETPLSLQKACMSHELTHALQDDAFDLKKLDLDRKDNDDYLLAVKSVAEGDAVLVMIEYMTQAAVSDPQLMSDLMRLNENPGMIATAVLDSAPDCLKAELLFPYVSGVGFVSTLKARGGWPLVNEAYRHLPLSSEQILHPEKYLDRPDPPILVSMPDLSKTFGAQWKLLASNVMGEFSVRMLMKEFHLADKTDAVAGGWGGDEIEIYRWLPQPPGDGSSDKVAIAWFTTWDTEKDAGEFYDAYTALLRMKYPEGRPKLGPKPPRREWTEADQSRPKPAAAQNAPRQLVWFTAQDDVLLEQRKSDVLVIEGCPDDRMDAVAKEAWGAKTKRAAFTPPPVGQAAVPQAPQNPLDAALKGMAGVPEGAGDLLAAFLQGPRSQGEVQGNRYDDYTYAFEIAAPGPGWTLDRDTPVSMMPIMLMNPSTSASVNVAVFNMSLEPVEAWAPMLEMMLPMQFQQFKKLGSGRITLNQLPAYEMAYSGSKDGLSFRIRQILLAAGGKTYVITCGAVAEHYEGAAKDFDKILKSFKIMKPQPEKGAKGAK